MLSIWCASCEKRVIERQMPELLTRENFAINKFSGTLKYDCSIKSAFDAMQFCIQNEHAQIQKKHTTRDINGAVCLLINLTFKWFAKVQFNWVCFCISAPLNYIAPYDLLQINYSCLKQFTEAKRCERSSFPKKTTVFFFISTCQTSMWKDNKTSVIK